MNRIYLNHAFRTVSLIFIAFFMLCSASIAQHSQVIASHSTVHVLTSHNQSPAATPIQGLIHIEMKPGWYTYWDNPGDSGLPPTMRLSKRSNVELSPLQFFPPEIIKVGDLIDYGYYQDAYFLFEIKLLPSFKDKSIALNLEWVTCDDMCIPQQATVEIPLQVGPSEPSAESSWIEQYRQQFAKLEKVRGTVQIDEDQLKLELPLGQNLLSKPFLYVAPKEAVKKPHLQQWQSFQDKSVVTLRAGDNPNQALHGFVQAGNDNTIRFDTPAPTISTYSKPAQLNLWLAIAFALLGGLILNIMPCVFPILTLKVLALVKMRAEPLSTRLHLSLAYTVGILVSFAILATITTALMQLGHFVGWGFQMQSTPFLIAMAYILYLVACNLLGWFEFGGVSVSESNHNRSAWRSHFYAGLLVTLVATPCTAPFMAPAVGFALSQDVATIFVIFMAMGLGLSSPYILASVAPKLTAFIPKPGPWLIRFKQALAFPMLLSVVWLLWILTKTAQANTVGLVLLALVMTALLFGVRNAFPTHNKTKFVFWLITLLALAAPFYPTNPSNAEQPVFVKQDFDDFISAHDKVLVNVTADWCLTCKANEAVLLLPDVQNFLKAQNIDIYTIDWTKPNEDIRLYLQSFDRAGVPLYVFYQQATPTKVLPQWLTPGIIKGLKEE